jgi:hypothetical protein
MRKSAVVVPILALVTGLVGFFFRKMEVSTVFDPVTGLAKRGASVTTLMIGIAVLAAVIAVVSAVLTVRRYASEPEYTRAFAPRGMAYLGVSFLASAAWLVGSIWYFAGQMAARAVPEGVVPMPGAGAFSIIDLLFTVLAALSAISVIILARRAYKGSAGSEMLVFSVIPSIFFCFWLVVLYKNNAANPILLSYCYQTLAIAAAALSTYFSAGYVFGKAPTGKTIVSFFLAIFFCMVVLADNIGLPLKLLFGATAVIVLINTVVFLRNLKPRNE